MKEEEIKFSDFKLHKKTNRALQDLGFETPTKIQKKSIPLVQEGGDVAGLAQTGTGKTAAFLIPVIQRLYKTLKVEGYEDQNEKTKPYENWGARSIVLVLVPTRELCEQVAENLKDLTPDKDFKYVTIYGGVAYEKQQERLKEGATFVIATPGRLIDLYKEKFFDPNLVRCVIFDEADRMFDMGFKDDMKYLLDRIPRDRQFLVFSATLNFDVLTVAYEYGSNPTEIEIDRELPKTDQVKDEVLHIGQDEKPKFLFSVLKNQNYEQAIVFSNFVRNVPKIEKFLRENGFKALGISSALSQKQRTSVMTKFKNGEANILVATDVAARGLDIENVDLVINFELPDDSENYVHRIGRTGRAGREGVAISLTSEKDVEALNRLQNFLEEKIAIGWLEEDGLIDDFAPFPYSYDPRAKLKDFKKKDHRGGRSSEGRSRKSFHQQKRERKRKGEHQNTSVPQPKAKKAKNNQRKSATKAPKKSAASKRYKNFKTVPRSNGGGILSKIKSFFSN